MKLKAIQSAALSKPYEPRYVLVNEETGEIIDDAQGYGYKSIRNAYAAGSYKFRDKSKDKEKAEKERKIAKWLKEHHDFSQLMECIAFDIAKGSCGPDAKFDTKLVKEMLAQADYIDLPFTAGELLKYWKNGPKYSKKKRKGEEYQES